MLRDTIKKIVYLLKVSLVLWMLPIFCTLSIKIPLSNHFMPILSYFTSWKALAFEHFQWVKEWNTSVKWVKRKAISEARYVIKISKEKNHPLILLIACDKFRFPAMTALMGWLFGYVGKNQDQWKLFSLFFCEGRKIIVRYEFGGTFLSNSKIMKIITVWFKIKYNDV